MTDPRGIADFLFQLESARSPAGKIRVLLQGWGELRALTPSQRLEVARKLGFEGAEDLVTRIAVERGSLPPAMLVEALRKAGSSGEDVGGLLSQLRQPEQRKGLVQKGLAALESLIVNGSLPDPESSSPDSSGRPPAGVPPAPVVAGEDAWDLGVKEDVREGDLALPPDSPDQAKSEAEPVVPPPPPVVEEAELAAPEPEPPPAGMPRPAEPRTTGEETVRRARGVVAEEPAARRREEPPPAASVRPAVRQWQAAAREDARRAAEDALAVDVDELRRQLAELRGPIARLRLLRSQAAELRSLGAREISPLLDAFPEEWARRRALLALLAVGAPADVEDAVRLASGLETRAARRWYYATLVSLKSLNAEERRVLAGREELGSALRRRLGAVEVVGA